MRCTAMKGKARCVMMTGHAGWHTDGSWLEWLADNERKAAFKQDPCPASVQYDDTTTLRCELPNKHQVAHRSEGIIWTDPNPIPEARKPYGG